MLLALLIIPAAFFAIAVIFGAVNGRNTRIDGPAGTFLRLARPRSSIAMATSLWLGDRHLMLVRSSGMREEYQRFDFRDIRGFYVEKSWQTPVLWLVWLGLVVLVALLFLLMRYLAGEKAEVSNMTMTITMTIMMGIFLGMGAAAAWNMGRTRRVYVATRLQTALLAPLASARQVRRFMERVVPLVNAAQAQATPEN
ncbi:hypothetical protein OPIT5_26380 [Opitutaceae bacterium TAV5]|nr:hypothetical protein OPIT5_26380 [Opitutaceae bacterium TAV5]